MALAPEELPGYLMDVAGESLVAGEKPEPVDLFNELGGYFWSSAKRRAGFRSSRGSRVFKAMFPDWETFVI